MIAQKLNPRFSILMLVIMLLAIMRIANSAELTPWSNFTPIGAMGLFGGAYFDKKWKAFLFPLLTLFISDVFINQVIFKGKYGIMYSSWYFIYGIFLLITLLGKIIIKNVTIKNVIGASIAAAVTHWLLADFVVWVFGGTDLRTMQPLSRDVNGLVQCYIQGFPFMRNFLAGTIVYSGIMFGAFEWLKLKKPTLALA